MAEGLQFCAVPNFLGTSGQCQWRKRDLTYSVTASLGGLPDDAWLAAIKLAWSYWEAVCNIHATYTEDAVNADMLVAVGAIDGPSGVLAWSEMPCGAADPDQLNQRYDRSEDWVVAENPGQGQLDIVRVACHEIGHLIGLPHFNQGAPALLAPTYSTTIRRPQPMDIAAAQDRYGPPLTVPVPPQPPVPIPPVPTPNPPGGSMDLYTILSTVLTAIAKATPTPIDDALLPVLLAVLKGLLSGALKPAQVEAMLLEHNITLES